MAPFNLIASEYINKKHGIVNFKPYPFHFFKIGYEDATVEANEITLIEDESDLEKFKVGFSKFLNSETPEREFQVIK